MKLILTVLLETRALVRFNILFREFKGIAEDSLLTHLNHYWPNLYLMMNTLPYCGYTDSYLVCVSYTATIQFSAQYSSLTLWFVF